MYNTNIVIAPQLNMRISSLPVKQISVGPATYNI